MRITTLAPLAALAVLLPGPSSAQPSPQNLVINGDFEDTTSVGCDFNLDNLSFTAAMANSQAFGLAEQLDIMDGDCGYGPAPQSGTRKLGFSSEGVGGFVDSFSLTLAAGVEVGTSYTLDFWAHAAIFSFSPDVGTIRVGISSSATSVGTEVFSGSAGSAGWTNFVSTFVAPVSGGFLTISKLNDTDSWTHIDNIRLFGSDVGTNYCISTPTSLGAASEISASGSASLSANNLVLSANNLPSQPGKFIAGPTQAQIPFFNGFLCIEPGGLQRFVSVTSPVGGVITEAVDYATSALGGLNVTPGSSYFYQRWNRDPDAGSGNANFSDAIEIEHTP